MKIVLVLIVNYRRYNLQACSRLLARWTLEAYGFFGWCPTTAIVTQMAYTQTQQLTHEQPSVIFYMQCAVV